MAVINATPASVDPAKAGLAASFPEADVWTLLDDRLIREVQDAGGLTPELDRRMRDLIAYAVFAGADAVLLSCSMYGPSVAAARAEHGIPMLGSDDALFEQVAGAGYRRVLFLGPLQQAVNDSLERLNVALQQANSTTTVVGHAVAGAADAVAARDWDSLHHALTTAALAFFGDIDAVVLGNFSIAPARARLQDELGLPVLSPTEVAAARLRDAVFAATGKP